MKIRIMRALLSLTLLTLTALAVSCSGSNSPQKDVKEKTEDLYSDAQEEVCEMINGKLECTYKKVANEAKDIQKKIKDKASESK